MIYEKMIETENSDMRRHAWTGYRRALTEYVKDETESYFRREHLADQGKLRDGKFSLDEYLEGKNKPVMAIWGAGRCNDLDLGMLAPYVDFVLIDRDVDAIRMAKKRYGFSDEQCQCIDLGFWEIFEEEERFFETLLAEADDMHLSEYLRQLKASIVKPQIEELQYRDAFDFSVVCGVASQLNTRFAGLLDCYGKDLQDFPATVEVLQEMNKQAAAYLFDSVAQTTKYAMFTANEMCAAKPEQDRVLSEYAQIWTEEWEQIVSMQKADETGNPEAEEKKCRVAGSREFCQEIKHARDCGILEIRHRCGMVWPFSEEKHFFMDVLTAYFINKKTK